ncbi:hypothetical protein O181_109800 [Austropuccinia psidii MF-1]|uniref:Uncharacterized protein n=1 Tax=Austropuccinia psidii MF-1 TaxID=1389203 RepID=A0A9Q3JZ59_9BASI|nr:hypothetical protein [Austropuccinia psidii MF-1]
MDTKVGLGGKPKLSTNGPMILGDLKWKKPMNLPNLMLIKTKLWFCQQKHRLTALYPDISEFMIHRKILRQCGGGLEHAVKRRTNEQSSAEDIINILEEVTTRTKIGSSKPADIIRKCHICQSTTHLANTCPQRGKINEIDIEKEPDVEKDNNIEENSDEKSSIFSESLKDIENINATFDIMESYSHLPQLSNCQLDLSNIQDAQLMKTKANSAKGYTAGAFCSCAGKSFLKTCVANFEDHLLPIDGIKLNSASNPMRALGIFETNIILPHINGNLRITVEFFVMENCASTHFILGNDYLIMYGIDLPNNKDRYFTIRDNECKTFSFLPFKRQITVSKVAEVSLELEIFKSEQGVFASDKEPLGEIIGHEVDIILNIERPYPPLLRRPAYPESPKSREALEIHIRELLGLGVIRNVGHNEEVEITTPVIVEWHN